MTSVQTLENLGRKRLSPGFFLRDFMHSEIAQVEGIGNLPVDSGTLVRAGTGLCVHILEPMQAALGKVSIRSGYRSPEVNRIGNEKGRTDHAHQWDRRQIQRDCPRASLLKIELRPEHEGKDVVKRLLLNP